MTIYFDYSTMIKWTGNPTGIPRTVYCLAGAIKKLYPDTLLVAIDDELGAFHHVVEVDSNYIVAGKVDFCKGDILFSAGANWAFGCYNDQVSLMKKNGGYFFQLFYDIIPTLFPYYYEQGRAFGDYFGEWTKKTFTLCDAAFAISECTKRDVAAWCGLSTEEADRIHVIRLGEDFESPKSIENEQDRFRDLSGILLSVGTIEIRKNQISLLNAYRILAKRHPGRLPKLVLVGRKGWIDGSIEFQVQNDRELSNLVQIINDATDYELERLYECCLFTLFPAFYEGWGLPVSESLKHGKPCICSNVSSMCEIAPNLTRFASPYSVEEWVRQIEGLLFTNNLLECESQLIKKNYVSTRWADTVLEIKKFLPME
jgi:glycosyltransferase involved in cell wall biosynthesis